ncbi:unnamed protein product [Calypogeia fissa]
MSLELGGVPLAPELVAPGGRAGCQVPASVAPLPQLRPAARARSSPRVNSGLQPYAPPPSPVAPRKLSCRWAPSSLSPCGSPEATRGWQLQDSPVDFFLNPPHTRGPMQPSLAMSQQPPPRLATSRSPLDMCFGHHI